MAKKPKAESEVREAKLDALIDALHEQLTVAHAASVESFTADAQEQAEPEAFVTTITSMERGHIVEVIAQLDYPALRVLSRVAEVLHDIEMGEPS